jgi:uncharacterized membrane-anchored protein
MESFKIWAVMLGMGVAVGAQTASAQDSAQQQNAAQEIRSLHWVEGPTQVSVGLNATFKIPAGYRFLGPADTIKFMRLAQNLPPASGATIFAPDNFRWWGMFEYWDSGYVTDNGKIDPNEIMSSVKQSQIAANKQLTARGWPTMDIVGWEYKPFYDPATNNLSWAIDARSSRGDEVANFNTRLLGRTGYTSAVLVADTDALQGSVSQFKDVVAGYQFIADQTYSSYKPGDQVAGYGLAALITGGAVAVAAKTGLWKVILGALIAAWKFIALAVVAGFAAVGKFFKRLLGMDKEK